MFLSKAITKKHNMNNESCIININSESESCNNAFWLHIGRANVKYYFKDNYVPVTTIKKLVEKSFTREMIRIIASRFISRFSNNINNNIDRDRYIKWLDETQKAIENNEYWFEISDKFTIDRSISPKSRYEKIFPNLDNNRIVKQN
jgi:hypothetical protein